MGVQTGWWWCQKCQAIFASVSGHERVVCPADDRPHDGSTSLAYVVMLGDDGPGQQGNWRWCGQGRGLFALHPDGQIQGVCAADGRSDDGARSLHYAALLGDGSSGQQGGWRWCMNVNRCITARDRACALHGRADGHDGSTSAHYMALVGEDRGEILEPDTFKGTYPAQQGGWPWCELCKGLFHAGTGEKNGACPSDPSGTTPPVVSFTSVRLAIVEHTVMTVVGRQINGYPTNTSACPSQEGLATHPAVAQAPADPYAAAAEGILDTPDLGIDPRHIKSGGVSDPLKQMGNWASNRPGNMGLGAIAAELNAGRPVATDIAWNTGGSHCVAIAGVQDDTVLVMDPVNGASVSQFSQFLLSTSAAPHSMISPSRRTGDRPQ